MIAEEYNSLLESQLTAAIEDSLQNSVPANASFLGEMLCTIRESESNRILLADCYLQENKAYKVLHILKNCYTEVARYKYALACMKLNKLQELERALRIDAETIANGSYGMLLMGNMCEKLLNWKEAAK